MSENMEFAKETYRIGLKDNNLPFNLIYPDAVASGSFIYSNSFNASGKGARLRLSIPFIWAIATP